jgi:hypothetical protein
MSDSNQQPALKVELTIDVKFIKLARELRTAQKEAQAMGHTARDQRKAKSLEQLFDAKLEAIEKEIAHLLQINKPAPFPERLL